MATEEEEVTVVTEVIETEVVEGSRGTIILMVTQPRGLNIERSKNVISVPWTKIETILCLEQEC